MCTNAAFRGDQNIYPVLLPLFMLMPTEHVQTRGSGKLSNHSSPLIFFYWRAAYQITYLVLFLFFANKCAPYMYLCYSNNSRGAAKGRHSRVSE